jgi:hypothetical protein
MRAPRQFLAALFAATLNGLLAAASSAFAAQIAVTTTVESPGADGDCTLGEAIQAAEGDGRVDACAAGAGADTITLPTGIYSLGSAVTTSAGRSAFLVTTAIRIVGRTVTLRADHSAGELRFFQVASTGELTLEGLTLTGGVAQGAAGTYGNGGPGQGGAVYNAGQLRLFYVVLSYNYALGGDGGQEPSSAGAGGAGRGGAVYSIGSVTAVRSRFLENAALGGAGGPGYSMDATAGAGGPAEGGAVYSTNSSLVLTDSRLFGNRAYGGPSGHGRPLETTGNHGGHAAGGAVYSTGTVTISGCMMTGNIVVGGSGKVGARGEGGAIFGSVRMTFTTLRGNHAFGGTGRFFIGPGGVGAGGGLRTWGSVVRGCAIMENGAEGGLGWDGEVTSPGVGGGVSVFGTTSLTNVTLSGNDARGAAGRRVEGGLATGGGVDVSDGALLTLIHCTIANNTANGGAGALAASVGAITLAGTVVANDSGRADNCSGPISDAGDNLQYPGGTCGATIPEADPRFGFLDAEATTYPLQSGSPALDAASNTACPADDQRRHTRPLDGDGDGTAICDIGALEADHPPTLGDLLFRDGFESGDVSRWPAGFTDEGDLAVTAAAALDATALGLQAFVDDTAALYLEDSSPEREDRYRARFYFDPGDFDPGTAARHFSARIFLGFGADTGRRLFAVVLKWQDGEYSLMPSARFDGRGRFAGGFHPITRGTHVIELDWKRSSTAGSDGWLLLWIDGVAVEQLTGLDNRDSALGFARLGAMGLKAGASGTLYFDGFESRRETYIGP